MDILLRVFNLLLSLCIPLTIGFVSSRFAKPRGRGAKIWFLLGFIAGVIGILPLAIPDFGVEGIAIACFIFLSPVLAVRFMQPLVGTGVLAVCPHCAETVKAEARVCKHCGGAIK